MGLFKRDKTKSSDQSAHPAVVNLLGVDFASIVDPPEFDERATQAITELCDSRRDAA